MKTSSQRLAHRINRFVQNPLTNLVQGIALLVIGLSDASNALNNDISHNRLRVGHGLIIIGAFGILGTLPQLIGSLEAGGRYLEFRDFKDRSDPETSIVPQEGDE